MDGRIKSGHDGVVAVAASASTLPEYPLDIRTGADHLEAASAEAARIGDAETEDLFVGVSRNIGETLWLVEAHARADR